VRLCEDSFVPRVPRRAGPIGLALTAYDLWKKLPPGQREMIAAKAKRYGPAVAAGALRSARAAAEAVKKRRPS
jgi:hypothetical protein